MTSEMKHTFHDNARPSCAQVHWAETLRDRLPSHLIHDFGRPSCAQVIWAETLRERLASHSIFVASTDTSFLTTPILINIHILSSH